jgi:hypothetical protein
MFYVQYTHSKEFKKFLASLKFVHMVRGLLLSAYFVYSVCILMNPNT